MKKDKVSIIIPVYNVEHLLDKCIESILNQTHKNVEIILVNDGSTDNSRQVCDKYSDKYDFVKVVHQKNAGQSAARNTGLKLVSGDYMMFIDSDDWIDKNMIEVLLKYLKENNAQVVECDLSYSNLIDKNVDFNEKNHTILIETRIEALKRIITNQRFSVCVRLYEKSTVEGIKFVEGKNAPDVYYTCEVFNKTNKNVYINYPFYKYYYNPKSITKKPYTLKKLDSLDAALFLEDNVKENDPDLKKAVASNLLYASTYHYKYINYYKDLDPNWELRKKLKNLIDMNYDKDFNNSFSAKAARYLPLSVYSFLLSLNKKRKRG